MKNVTILLAVAAVVAMAVPAWGGVGAFFTWKGSATDTNWETPGNWVISPYLTAPHLGNTYDFYADAGYTILATKPLATVYASTVSRLYFRITGRLADRVDRTLNPARRPYHEKEVYR